MRDEIGDWSMVPKAEMDCLNWENFSKSYASYAQLVLSSEADVLYCHLHSNENPVTANIHDENGPVHRDSCLEFFLMPNPESGEHPKYYNFEINPKGFMKVGFGKERSDRVYLHFEKSFRDLFKIRTCVNESGWDVWYDIDFRILGIQLGTNLMKGNFYKCGDLTSIAHYQSWNPIFSGKPNFHCPEYFGILDVKRI